ncbi:twin-arginine translocase TatA/TatE family subunit [Acetobacter conturbans]|uniref:Sec-independent protein translocase protein TatA n=1 Tax=Acetobacter conturbans TaxID=1737472 RepID=A0ABX0K0G8_9PROT|nr:twin-arginine translocase TatA/TatE family subunit [Acetobacter conturbans]NHN87770.1 twin-arginine translocase TatA/TatE family subunit [Acetobacter conturbans]
MGSLSIWHWLIVLAVVLIVFGGSGKISTLMGDFAKGIKSFKRNMEDDESMEHGSAADSRISPPPATPANFQSEVRPTTPASNGTNTH